MTTISDIVGAFAKEYLERFPHLPLSHQKTFSAMQNCRSGHYGHCEEEARQVRQTDHDFKRPDTRACPT